MSERKRLIKRTIYIIILILFLVYFVFLFQSNGEAGPVILNGNSNLIKELSQPYEFRKNVAEYVSSLADGNGFDISKNDVKSPTIRTTYLGLDVLDKISFGKYNKKKLRELLNESYNEQGFYKSKDADNEVKETFFAIKISKLLKIDVKPKVISWIKEQVKKEQSDEDLYYLYCGLSKVEKIDKELINENLKNLKVIKKREGVRVNAEISSFDRISGFFTNSLKKEERNETIIVNKKDYYLEGDATNERLFYVWKALECLGEDKLDRSLLCPKYGLIDIATSRTLDSMFIRLRLIEDFCGYEHNTDKKIATLSRFYNPGTGSFFIKRGEDNSIYPTYLSIVLLDDLDLFN